MRLGSCFLMLRLRLWMQQKGMRCDTIAMVSYLVLPDILVIDVADALAVNPVPAKAAEAKKMLDNTAVILLKRVAVFRFTVLPLSSLIGNCLKV